MFDWILKATKKDNGKIVVDSLTQRVTIEDESWLWSKALSKLVADDLADQINIALLRIEYGDDVIDQTIMAIDDYQNKSKYKKAITHYGEPSFPLTYRRLATVLAKKYIEENPML